MPSTPFSFDADTVRLPAFVTAHSHAFQRSMRGRAQRPAQGGHDDFWSWREAMYEAASRLDPERLYETAHLAYRELQEAGVAMVGEFHYVHHQADGTPYQSRTAMSDAVIQAALDVGLSIALLRVIYSRAGASRPPEGVQRRFADGSLDLGLADVDALASRWAGRGDVRIGLAPHSVRAVPPEWLAPIAAFARERGLVVHMHVAEQRAEVESCLAETGRRPVELCAEAGLLGATFTAVHATHLGAGEAALLGRAGARVCLCPTTERDLGDGLPDVTALREAGVRLCTGVDSYVLVDPFEDMRGIELGERLRTETRITDRSAASPAERLLWAATYGGAESLGFESPGTSIELDRHATALVGVDGDHLVDAVVFSGTTRLVRGTPRTERA